MWQNESKWKGLEKSEWVRLRRPLRSFEGKKSFQRLSNNLNTKQQFLSLKIDTPKKLTSKQRALLMAYAELETDTPGKTEIFSSKVSLDLSILTF